MICHCCEPTPQERLDDAKRARAKHALYVNDDRSGIEAAWLDLAIARAERALLAVPSLTTET